MKQGFAKIFLVLAMMGMPMGAHAQTPKQTKKPNTHLVKEYTSFLLRLCNSNAYYAVRRGDKKDAEKRSYADAAAEIPQLVRDSTAHADAIAKYADIISDMHIAGKQPDFIYATFAATDAYAERKADTTSKEYQLGKYISKYTDTVKQLKLARYTMRINNQQK